MNQIRDGHALEPPDSAVPRAGEVETPKPPSRPALLPRTKWARWALVFLLAFTLIRGGIWAMTQPYFWAPDEDYHFLYVEHLTTQKAIISPDRPLYPSEYPAVAQRTHHDSYAAGPRRDFSGDPKRSVRKLGELPRKAREPSQFGRGVNVVHPPLYHVAGAIVNWSLGGTSVLTRIAAVRWVSTLFGVLAVYFAWLLAAQVFRREPVQLTAAFLVAVQPMIGFLSGIVNHDVALIAAFNATLAFTLFMLRTPPAARQGLWLGGAIALALLVKASALALLPLAGLAYIAQGLAYRGQWREVGRSAAIAFGTVFILAGWWYLRSVLSYGSLTGAIGDVVPDREQSPATLGTIWSLVREWTGLTYRTYWWHYFWWEAPRGSGLFFVPAFVGAVGLLGLLAYLTEHRRALFSRANPRVRQISLMVLAVFVLYVPPLTADVMRRLNGEGFILVAGRFLLPAYAAVAVLLLIGIQHLIRRRYLPWALGGLALVASIFSWAVWTDTYVHRYFGEGGWQELLRRMSFDRPEFVTPTTYTFAMILMFATLVAGLVAMAVGTRRGGEESAPVDSETDVTIRGPAITGQVPAGSSRAT